MAINRKVTNHAVVLSVSGKLMGGPETVEIHEEVKSCIADGFRHIIIDLARVKWLNSAGLGVLIASLTSTRNAGGELHIVGANKKVNSLFVLTKLVTVFETFDTIGDAMTIRA